MRSADVEERGIGGENLEACAGGEQCREDIGLDAQWGPGRELVEQPLAKEIDAAIDDTGSGLLLPKAGEAAVRSDGEGSVTAGIGHVDSQHDSIEIFVLHPLLSGTGIGQNERISVGNHERITERSRRCGEAYRSASAEGLAFDHSDGVGPPGKVGFGHLCQVAERNDGSRDSLASPVAEDPFEEWLVGHGDHWLGEVRMEIPQMGSKTSRQYDHSGRQRQLRNDLTRKTLISSRVT